MAYTFDETNDYITLADSSEQDIASEAAWSFWVKVPDITGSDFQQIFYKAHSSSSANIGVHFYETSHADGGKFEVSLTDGGGDNVNVKSSSSVMSTDTWMHFCFVKDSGDTLTVYKDGSSIGSATNTLLGLVNPDQTLYIGSINGSSNFFGGQIAEFAFWRNGVITTEQITALANGCPPPLIIDSNGTRLRYYCKFLTNLREDEWRDHSAADVTATNNGATVSQDHPPVYRLNSTQPYWHVIEQNITAPLSSVTGLYAPASIDLTFILNGVLEQATLYAPAAITEGLTLGGVLLNATGLHVASVPWDQNVTAPVITASGNVVAAVTWDQQLAGALLQATGTLDTGAWLIDQNIAGQILSATGILDTQTWLIDQNMAGVYITPTGLIAASVKNLWSPVETAGSNTWTDTEHDETTLSWADVEHDETTLSWSDTE